MRLCSLALLLLATPSALAVPMQLNHQGRLSDSAGTPLEGAHQLQIAIYTESSGGSPLWTDTVSAEFDRGAYSVILGATGGAAIDSTIFDGSVRYVSIAVDGGAPLPQRLPITSVPYAMQAGHAATAAALTEPVQWSDIEGAPADADTLGDLACGDGEVPTWQGGGWACANPVPASVDMSTLSGTISVDNLPVGTSNGTVAAGDHTHSFSQITGDLGLDRTTGNLDVSRLTGTIPASRLPVGTGNTDVAAGNHTHAASAITSGTLDAARLPTGVAGNWSAGGNLVATGGVQAGTTSASCTTALNGMIRYASNRLEVCTSAGWQALWVEPTGTSQANAGFSCKAILDRTPGATSGSYWIDPNGGNVSDAFQVYCDMTTDGGGWTRVVTSIGGDTSTCNTMNRWQRALQVTQLWTSPGQVLSKYYNVSQVAPNATPVSVVRFGPGPYGNVRTMFTFPKGNDGWTHSNSSAFALSTLVGQTYGNGIWWDWGGTPQRKANFCIGTSPDHHACWYDGTDHGQCGAIYNNGSWSSSSRAHELYVRE